MGANKAMAAAAAAAGAKASKDLPNHKGREGGDRESKDASWVNLKLEHV